MPYLLDADWIINAARQRRHALETLQMLSVTDNIYVSLITLAEIYDSAYDSANPEAYINSYKTLLGKFQIADLTEAIISEFAEVRADLRRHGRLIPDFDILIGVTATHYNLTLLTFNIRHLDRIPNIRIYHP